MLPSLPDRDKDKDILQVATDALLVGGIRTKRLSSTNQEVPAMSLPLYLIPALQCCDAVA